MESSKQGVHKSKNIKGLEFDFGHGLMKHGGSGDPLAIIKSFKDRVAIRKEVKIAAR